MKAMSVRLAALVVFTVCGSTAALGNEFFEKKIRPVLAEQCYACHSAKIKTPMGDLRLDTAQGLASAAQGKLMAAIGYTDLKLRMPPQGKLAPEVIADFQKWIEMGAPHTLGENKTEASKTIDWEEARQFWAFQPLNPPQGDHSIDSLLAARRQNLATAPPAGKREWIRRVTFDLTGLPPTPAEIDVFLNDDSAGARQKVVQRLLGSPHYGERWARHWLDLVRFSETNGHEFDNDKLDAWRYRDYIIRAFNQDIGYDQLVLEHIAGDLLPQKRKSLDAAYFESPLGTSMYWFGEVLNSATDSVKSRADTVDNQIDVLSKTFLGLTVACARCHDHKFDPIPTKDYYALAGTMHSTYVREAVLDTPGHAAAIRAAAAQVPAHIKEGKWRLREGDVLFTDFSDFTGWDISGAAFGRQPYFGVAASWDKPLVGSLTSARFKMPKLWVHVRLHGTQQPKGQPGLAPVRVTLVADDHKSQHFLPNKSEGWHWRTIRMTKEIGRSCYFEIVDRDPDGFLAVDAIIFSDHQEPPDVAEPGEFRLSSAPPNGVPSSYWGMVAGDESPHNVRLHVRGSHTNLGEEVPRGSLQIIGGARVETGSGRLELARSILKSPLAARVMVNRIWKHHFGTGLAASTDNFGQTGARPSHPELLDWLARQFIDSGWSIKAMHRLILSSDAYAMSSRPHPDSLGKDPNNKLVHYMPVRRLEAEAIRDSMLAVSGTLNTTMFGPGVTPHISKYQDGRGKPVSGPLDANGRRSIYIQVRRNFLTPMFLAFDYPLPVSTIGARGSSTVPSQALLMLNNEFVAAAAETWADKLTREQTGPDARIQSMYLTAFGRPPEDWERAELKTYLAKNGSWSDLCHVLFNSAEFIYVR